jgi:replicative DNA helicase
MMSAVDRWDEVLATAPDRRDVWHPPEPLSRSGNLPDFPVKVLPEPFAGMVTAVAEFTQTDPGMAGTSVLGMLAACCGGRVEVEPRPGWREPCNLFTATVARPGERKSAVQGVLSGPLMDAERELVARAAPEIREAKTNQEIEEKNATRAIHLAANPPKGKDVNELRSEAHSAAAAAEAITIPVMPRILADDTTPEAAASLLAEQDGRLAIVSAEGGIFDIIAGRYSSGNVANVDVWLKGHAGDRLRIDRKGRPAEYVEHPALTVAVMIQPAVLTAIALNPLMRGRGLLARFLYCLPASRVGYRHSRPEPVADGISNRYRTTLRDLAVTLAEWTQDRAVVKLDQLAAAELQEFQDSIERRMRAEGDLAHIRDWANKVAGAAVRLSGLLHMAANPADGWRTMVTGESMAGAITLADFFVEHALSAFDCMNCDPVVADAEMIVAALVAGGISEFTLRDLHRTIVRTKFRSAADAGPALSLLTDHDWIRPVPDEGRVGPGRKPSPRYQFYPAARNARNARNNSAGG